MPPIIHLKSFQGKFLCYKRLECLSISFLDISINSSIHLRFFNEKSDKIKALYQNILSNNLLSIDSTNYFQNYKKEHIKELDH